MARVLLVFVVNFNGTLLHKVLCLLYRFAVTSKSNEGVTGNIYHKILDMPKLYTPSFFKHSIVNNTILICICSSQKKIHDDMYMYMVCKSRPILYSAIWTKRGYSQSNNESRISGDTE